MMSPYRVVRGPRIQKRHELLVADGDIQLHGVLCANAGDCMEGDHWCLWTKHRGIGRCGGGVYGGIVVVGFFNHVISGLQLEQMWALVTANVRLITVIAQAELEVLSHLHRRQKFEGP